MSSFVLYSFVKKDKNQRLYSSTAIDFFDEKIVLYDGFEVTDGDRVFEKEIDYTIDRKDTDKILSIILPKFKNESILLDYNGAKEYYSLLDIKDKIFFLIVLRYYKTESKFDLFLKVLDSTSISYNVSERIY